jgi:hypothetical protein
MNTTSRAAARGQPPREAQAFAGEVAHDLPGRASPAKGFKEQPHGPLNLRVGIEHEPPAAIRIDKPHRRPNPELAPAGLVEGTADQPGPQHMELRLTHRALEAEEQPVVEVTRVVNAILVEDERLTRAQISEPVPSLSPRQPGPPAPRPPGQADLGDQRQPWRSATGLDN